MIQKEWDMQSLSDALLQSVRRYGIKEVSMGQYETVCKKIVHFSSEYGRFQHRVIRMMISLAETGETDFSCCHSLRGEARTEMSTVMRHL